MIKREERDTVNHEKETIGQYFLRIEALLKEILTYSEQQFTGRLTIDTPNQKHQWRLYFGMGKLLWGSGGEHPRRRWRRQIAKASGHNHLKAHYSEDHLREGDQYECWDFHLLLALHKRKVLSGEQVKKVMVGMVSEIIFDLMIQGVALCTSEEAYPNEPNYCGKQVFIRDWKTGIRPSQQMVVPPSWGVETKTRLKELQQNWNQWRDGGLSHVSPDSAPRLLRWKQLEETTSANVYQNLVKLITGDRTLRDLSVLMKMETLKIARSLQPYLRQDLISLETVADLPIATTPSEKTSEKKQLQRREEDKTQNTASDSTPPNTTKERPLVAYIDDSEQSLQIMEQYIRNGGYDFIGINDSAQAIPLLLEKQPKLIFLDLIMPNINGYELCGQIRKISTMKEVPIVIVTGNDGIVDRMRSKVVGATNFISKPIDRSEVLTLALQYTQAN